MLSDLLVAIVNPSQGDLERQERFCSSHPVIVGVLMVLGLVAAMLVAGLQ